MRARRGGLGAAWRQVVQGLKGAEELVVTVTGVLAPVTGGDPSADHPTAASSPWLASRAFRVRVAGASVPYGRQRFALAVTGPRLWLLPAGYCGAPATPDGHGEGPRTSSSSSWEGVALAALGLVLLVAACASVAAARRAHRRAAQSPAVTGTAAAAARRAGYARAGSTSARLTGRSAGGGAFVQVDDDDDAHDGRAAHSSAEGAASGGNVRGDAEGSGVELGSVRNPLAGREALDNGGNDGEVRADETNAPLTRSALRHVEMI